ncbi:manganese-dependent inorganic pyrophosphatase [Shouchella clausii]|uniref:Probable manganese-dependent inorganic pyrophosphatase n=1 Tax=Shouchella clausii TaxID=79880 RepID=A0A268S1G5_SHOCL|nr:manganese-dependent inorganic pyrophosphatase [Shouchella clausii]AST96897.1 manganese-dependent inorganic pyrophosphatase [Shouchella clausii]MEB5475209.1 manganese-dependent inorganic pyrophosphatase [Shouchella clausii]PAF26320.1 manganese-dependent inorganic pyrophosphatase [Shouchella clausii]PTL24732.1 manganese-dependent inorganic pyrophosphatase [Shouchella clausii]QNM43254.1 manganese-dependent inorganic pyrophosphatase [Shouchella clausii]
MPKTLIFGHKNPDTDTICSAIAYADLKGQLGVETEAVRLGEPNGETLYALEAFGVNTPRLIEKAAGETDRVILVDHNERQQSVSDIDDVQVLEVIDHHRIANFETADPVYYRAEPVGCTATIIKKLYKEHGLDIPKPIAGLMLSAIISDSLLFKSPTCTEEDKQAAKELAEIAGVNAEEYGLNMLKAGADISDKTADELLTMDAKAFAMGAATVEIAQVNTVDTKDVLARQSELEKVITAKINDNGLDLFVFIITDILENDSVALVLGDKTAAFEQAFQTTLTNHTAVLKGVVSRKKQVVPPLTEAIANVN